MNNQNEGVLYKKEIAFEDITYPFYWGINCLDKIIESLISIESDRLVIVTDDKVKNLYIENLISKIGNKKPILILSSSPGEGNKTLTTLTEYIENAFKWGVTRQSIVVTLGGGVPGNIGGLLASLIFRGIRLIHIPTTLIAAFDSVISLKQAINSNLGKNHVGTFYTPTAIYLDLSIFKTLEKEEIKSGLCETIKNSLAICPEHIEELAYYLPLALQNDLIALSFILDISIKAKLKVMNEDKYEKKRALVLEYGHTIGHAIELYASRNELPRISHGEAVGIGMIAASEISGQLGILDKESIVSHHKMLDIIKVKKSLPNGITAESIIEIIRFDNKRGYIITDHEMIPMILLKKLGTPFSPDLNLPITDVSREVIKNTLKKLEHIF